MTITCFSYDLEFKAPAGTSRGVLQTKRSWFIRIEHEGVTALGECGVFKGLSADDRPEYEQVLRQSIADYQAGNLDLDQLRAWPSIVIGWEMVLADLTHGGKRLIYDNAFYQGRPIAINGLIWMGDKSAMLGQIKEKLAAGFRCVKLKIGAIDFGEELSLLRHIRAEYSANEIELRVDANGAFAPELALEKLKQLSAYDLHSIEQPIQQGQVEAMAELCSITPIPIALDEELIGVFEAADKAILLEQIKPQYIILKPSLVGGFAGSEEWVSAANQLGIPWWATSALESNVGLNAIAQWTAHQANPLPQGLGTGQLYTNNIPAPLEVDRGQLHYAQDAQWDMSPLEA